MLCTAKWFGKIPTPGRDGRMTANPAFSPCDCKVVRLHFPVFGEPCTQLPGDQVNFLCQGQS